MIGGVYQDQSLVNQQNQGYRSPQSIGTGVNPAPIGASREDLIARANYLDDLKSASKVGGEVFGLFADWNKYDSADRDLSERFRQANVNLDLTRKAELTSIYANAINGGLSIAAGPVQQQLYNVNNTYSQEAQRARGVYNQARRSIENAINPWQRV